MRKNRRGPWNRLGPLIAGGCVLLVSAACTNATGGDRDEPVKPQAKLSVRPEDGKQRVAPDKPVTVKVTDGSVKRITVKPKPGDGENGSKDSEAAEVPEVKGKLTDSKRTWKSTTPLAPDTKYVVRATAVDVNGKTSSVRTSFTTLEPDKVLHASISPLDGETVGVGMPIYMKFSEPVAEKFRDDVERRLDVSMSEPVEGAWHWMNGQELHFRPREYWPAGEKVTLTTNLVGVQGGKGLWGDQNRTVSFEIGERHVSVVDVDAHTMTVKSGGETVKTFPISAGSPKNPSSNGTHVALAKEGHIVMTSSSYGVPVDSPEGYRTPTDWNVRYTWSGQFIHSAPWSLGSQGEENVSHGCVNMSPSDAKWFYDFTVRGDIIKVRGSSRQVEPGNGWTDWNVPWDEWVAGSALDRSINAD